MSTFFPEGKKITIAGEDFTIKPFVLANRTKVLKIIAEILVEYGKVNPDQNLSKIEVGANLLQAIIEIAGDRIIGIYEAVLGKPREWLLDNVSLSDELNILQAIQEVNDLPFLFSQVKSLVQGARSQKSV